MTYAYKHGRWILISMPDNLKDIDNDYELYNLDEDAEEVYYIYIQKHNLMTIVGKDEQTSYIFHTLKLYLNRVQSTYNPVLNYY